ncbi:MAG: hypothetical protein DI607_14380 [Sphingomonas hengshuiensis]|nr:MAG: hypothetical protein DI607_14380 [Sphingomonas hengshuiensis]
MSVVEFVRGSTWDFAGLLSDVDGPIDLTGATVISQIRDPNGVLIDTLEGAVEDAANGVLSTYRAAAATAGWKLGTAETDVRVILASGVVIQTTKVSFEIVRGVSE